ncbi:MAG: hypothetical protein KAS32_08440 [Candidatus Peribacteraceae bacterium]|nr:hypothetical protein [Candidatus Peribacteraceae bacterium]
MKRLTEHKTQSLPAIDLPYDKETSWQRGNVFALAFVYPHPLFCKERHGEPFKLTGGILDIREFLAQQVLPAVVHITQFPKGRNKTDKKMSQWGVELFGVNARFVKTGDLYQIVKDETPTNRKIIVEYHKFFPRDWIPELEDHFLPEHRKILDKINRLDAKIDADQTELTGLQVKLSTEGLFGGEFRKKTIEKKVQKKEAQLKKHTEERGSCSPVCDLVCRCAA